MKTSLGARALWVAFLMLTAGAVGVAAGPETSDGRISLVEAVETALRDYPAMRIARATVDRSAEAVDEARAAWLPSLGFSAVAARYEEPVPVTPIHGFTLGLAPPFDEMVTHYSLNLDYTLFDGGGRRAGNRQADARLAASRASMEGAAQDLSARVVNAYLRVLGSREILIAQDHRVSALGSELDRVRQFFEQERAARIDLLRVEADIASAEADRVRSRAALDIAERELALLLGVDPGEVKADRLVGVALRGGSPPTAPRDSLVTLALKSNPAVMEARHAHGAAGRGLDLARSARWPRLGVGGNYFNQGDQDGNRVTEWKAEAFLNLPLFTGGATRSRIAGAKAAERGAMETVRLAEYEVTTQVNRALASIEESRARVESLERAVSATEEVVKIERLLLETGAGTQTDYLDAEAKLVSARANLIEARHGEIAANVELARALGTLDLEWLSRHLEIEP